MAQDMQFANPKVGMEPAVPQDKVKVEINKLNFYFGRANKSVSIPRKRFYYM